MYATHITRTLWRSISFGKFSLSSFYSCREKKSAWFNQIIRLNWQKLFSMDYPSESFESCFMLICWKSICLEPIYSSLIQGISPNEFEPNFQFVSFRLRMHLDWLDWKLGSDSFGLKSLDESHWFLTNFHRTRFKKFSRLVRNDLKWFGFAQIEILFEKFLITHLKIILGNP